MGVAWSAPKTLVKKMKLKISVGVVMTHLLTESEVWYVNYLASKEAHCCTYDEDDEPIHRKPRILRCFLNCPYCLLYESFSQDIISLLAEVRFQILQLWISFRVKWLECVFVVDY